MSRLRRFSGGLFSGYFVLAATSVFSLVSIPLALHYLSRAEFGLWTVASQMALYMNLLDFGMSGAGMRILIDHKDDREGTNYGSVIQTSLLVNLAHALLAAVGGVGAAFVIGPLLEIPAELESHLRWLMIGQSLLTAAGFSLRTAPMLLAAHQQYNSFNIIQVVLSMLGLVVLWAGFKSGLGVFSLMWAQGVSQVLTVLAAVILCLQVRLLPRPGRWGRPQRRWFWELFSYGRDMFLFSVGNLLISFSQSILITRAAGLEAVAVWGVCNRTFTLTSQLVNRIFDYAAAALAEMIVRQERDRLFQRFKSMVVFSASLGVVVGVTFAMANQPFVHWWTGGKIGWSRVNDWLLALWLIVLALVRDHAGIIGLTKDFRFLRYIYFLEGIVSVSLGYFALRYGGITAMLIVFVLGSLSISYPYCTWRASKYLQEPWQKTALGWLAPSLRLACLVVPIGLAIGWLAQPMSSMLRLLVSSLPVAAIGGLLLVRVGLDESLRQEVAGRLVKAFPAARFLTGRGKPPPPANGER